MSEHKPNWLKDAHYEYHPSAVLPWLDLYIPNSATTKQQRFRGKAQCDIIQCLLNEIGLDFKVVA